MEDLLKIRSRTQHGKKTYFLDARPVGSIWSDEGQPLETRHQAERLRDKIAAKVIAGRPLAAVIAEYRGRKTGSVFLVHTYLAKWLKRMEQRQAGGELSPTYLRELRRYAKTGGYFDFWRDRTIHQVNAATVDDFGAYLAERPKLDRQGNETDEGLSPNTQAKALDAFRSFVRWLVRRQEIPSEPPFPPIRKKGYEPTIISHDAQTAVLEQIPWDRRGAFLAAACGARPGEVRAFNLSDVVQDETGTWLRVHSACQGQNAHEPADVTKGREPGWCPVSEELLDWLVWRLDQVSLEDRVKGEIPLFVNPLGRIAAKRWLGNALREEWNRAAQRVGLKVRMYEGTKHSTATDALRRGVSLDTIQSALRHRDPASTKRYAQLGRQGIVDILRRPAVDAHLWLSENRPENASNTKDLWRGGRESNPQLLA